MAFFGEAKNVKFGKVTEPVKKEHLFEAGKVDFTLRTPLDD